VALLDPALVLLLRLKRRAYWRGFKRRLSTKRGRLFAFAGALFTLLWLGAMSLGPSARQASADFALPTARYILTFFAFLSAGSALLYRGLYMPEDEIERLFSAPLSRPDLVRYRLLTSFGREILFAVFIGILLARRMPRPEFAFLGSLLSMWAITCGSKGLSILVGDAHQKGARLISRIPRGWLRLLVGVGLWAVFALAVMGIGDSELSDAAPRSLMSIVGDTTWLNWVSFPSLPWARAISASTLSEFLPAFGLCLVLTALLFEIAARIPSDFRELSLQTSAEVNLKRARAGTTSAMSVSANRRHLPFVLGRSQFGSIFWMRLTSIIRRARGALIFSVAITGFGAYFISTVFDSAHTEGLVGLGLMCLIYMSAGLRFDFRSDLDHLESMRAWPVSAAKVFAASILPLVCWESLLFWAALIALRLAGFFHADQMIPCAVLFPPVAIFWVGMENILFLLNPVRIEPGQGAAMQHTGRRLILLLLRMALLAIGAGLVWGGTWVGGALGATLGVGEWAETWALSVSLGVVVLVWVGAVLWAGGRAFGRMGIENVDP